MPWQALSVNQPSARSSKRSWSGRQARGRGGASRRGPQLGRRSRRRRGHAFRRVFRRAAGPAAAMQHRRADRPPFPSLQSAFWATWHSSWTKVDDRWVGGWILPSFYTRFKCGGAAAGGAPRQVERRGKRAGVLWSAPQEASVQEAPALACRRLRRSGTPSSHAPLAVLCCAVLCCAVLCCAVLCCAVLCCAVHVSDHRQTLARCSAPPSLPSSSIHVEDTGEVVGLPQGVRWRIINSTFRCTGNETHPLPWPGTDSPLATGKLSRAWDAPGQRQACSQRCAPAGAARAGQQAAGWLQANQPLVPACPSPQVPARCRCWRRPWLRLWRR